MFSGWYCFVLCICSTSLFLGSAFGMFCSCLLDYGIILFIFQPKIIRLIIWASYISYSCNCIVTFVGVHDNVRSNGTEHQLVRTLLSLCTVLDLHCLKRLHTFEWFSAFPLSEKHLRLPICLLHIKVLVKRHLLHREMIASTGSKLFPFRLNTSLESLCPLKRGFCPDAFYEQQIHTSEHSVVWSESSLVVDILFTFL